jgi:hypothetical protein
MRMTVTALLLGAALLVPWSARAENFKVRHDHLRGGCKGELVFTDAGVEYKPEKKSSHAQSWRYADIQQMELDPEEISVLTYITSKLRGGADRIYHFKLLSGSITDEFRRQIADRLSRPLVSSVIPREGDARYTIPARLRHFMSGSQGSLEIGNEYVIYRADRKNESRVWRYTELLSIGSTGPFQLRIGALNKTGGEWGEEKNFLFDLKRRLTPEEYDFLWTKINLPKIGDVPHVNLFSEK